MRRRLLFVCLVFGFCFPLLGAGKPLKVVVTTSQLGALVKEIGRENVETTVLIPPGTCPGHYELRPGDVKALASGGVLVYHGWEGFVDGLVRAARPARVQACEIAVTGSWLTPPTQIRAAEQLTEFMSEVDKPHAAEYRVNLAGFVKVMRSLDEEVRGVVWRCDLMRRPVIASAQQKDFLIFLGLDVVATFGRDEDLTPVQLAGVLRAGREKRVNLVVDNLQSGAAAGRRIAERLGAIQVVLSNFPGGFAGTDTIERTIQENVGRLCQAVRTETDGKND